MQIFSNLTLGAKKEWEIFKSVSENCKRLILANFLYSFVFPLLIIITNAFIWRAAQDLQYNIAYSAGNYLGIVLGFLMNGFLLRKIRINFLYIIGMALSVSVISLIVFFQISSILTLLLFGIAMGIAGGLYWSNRNYLLQISTANEERNYVIGLETSLQTISGLISPLVFGASIMITHADGNAFEGYKWVVIGLIIMVLAASIVIAQGNFGIPKIGKFLYSSFSKNWNLQRRLLVVEGITEGAIFTIPGLLVLRLIGNEGILGIMESASVVISTLPIYLLGRFTKPEHRVSVLSAGIILFFIGTIILSIQFNLWGAVVLQGCYMLSRLTNYVNFIAIRMRSIDIAGSSEKREPYTYIMDTEFFLEAGRISGILLFFLLYTVFSQDFALRYGLLMIALIQFIAIYLAKNIKQKD